MYRLFRRKVEDMQLININIGLELPLAIFFFFFLALVSNRVFTNSNRVVWVTRNKLYFNNPLCYISIRVQRESSLAIT